MSHRATKRVAFCCLGFATGCSKGTGTRAAQAADAGDRLAATGALATALEELGDHEAAIALLGEAVTQHDAWLLQYTRGGRYDSLRKNPRGAAFLAKVEAW